MQLKDSVVLVTGANRVVGAAFVAQLKDRGVAKDLRSCARRQHRRRRRRPAELDVTDPDQVRAAADTAAHVQVLINNAGISTGWVVEDLAR